MGGCESVVEKGGWSKVKITQYLKLKIQQVAKKVRYLGNEGVNAVNQFQEK